MKSGRLIIFFKLVLLWRQQHFLNEIIKIIFKPIRERATTRIKLFTCQSQKLPEIVVTYLTS